MAKKTINIGTSANKGDGDPLRTAFGKINDNFDELYAQTGDDVQIPAQATHTGKFLTTNGTTLSWASGDGDRLVKGVHTVSLGTDGMLTLPNGLALPGGAGIFGDATGGYQITDSANSSYVTFDAGGLQLDTYDGSNIRLRTTPVGTADYKDWIFNSNGNLTFPNGSNQITAYTGSAQNIASEDAVNIDVNLTDSTLRRWRFGEDGDLTLPADAIIQTTSGNLTIEAETYVIIDSSTDGQIEIGRNSGVGAAILGNKSRGTNTIVDSDLLVNNGVYEKFSSLADATGTVTHNCSNGHIFYHTSPDANWTANFLNLNLSSGYATSVTLVIEQGATGYYPSAVRINYMVHNIKWQGNSTPTPSTNRTDVVTFSIICTATDTYTVLGQLTGF